MSSGQIYINKTPFLGRIEEQKQFRAVLRELLTQQSDEGLP